MVVDNFTQNNLLQHIAATKPMKCDEIKRTKKKTEAEESEYIVTDMKPEGDRDKPELDMEKQTIKRALR